MYKNKLTQKLNNDVIEYRFFKYYVNNEFVGYKMVKLDDIFPKKKYVA